MSEGTETQIEYRDPEEVAYTEGWDERSGRIARLRVAAVSSPVANPGFDITPARLVTGLVTEKGIFPATVEGIRNMTGS
jgi:methylthioribose-1-phosphate isomerase